jgi:hypothetical protein
LAKRDALTPAAGLDQVLGDLRVLAQGYLDAREVFYPDSLAIGDPL